MKPEIIPAILVDNAEEFIDRIHQCEDFAESVQWDIMDGQFVDATTFGDTEALADVDTTLTIEAHLMVQQPEEWLQKLSDAGVDRIIMHAESVDDLPRLVKKANAMNFDVAVAINPETPITAVDAVAKDLDEVLVMTVEPGEAGQRFLPLQLEKVKALRKKYPNLHIGVDGGINRETIILAHKAGADRFCVNSAIFKQPAPADAFALLNGSVS